MFQQFKEHINNHFPFLKDSKLLIAVSGGVDSVVLTHVCHDIGLHIALAHCNFNLRGEESDADEAFVLQLAEALNIEVFIQNFDAKNYAKAQKLSTQMAARELRYNWFNDLLQGLQFDYLLTAHHADDNLETFLINLFRGAGLEGLTGIPEQNKKIVRPLLNIPRTLIENYANQHGIIWREDASNASDTYLRNALRHHIIPKFKDINPQILENFQKTVTYLKEAEAIVKDQITSVKMAIVSKDEDENLVYNISKIKQLSNPKAYLYQLLKEYGFTEWNDVLELLQATSGKFLLSKSHRLLKDRDVLILSELKEGSDEIIVITQQDTDVVLPNGILFFDEADAFKKAENNMAFVDKDLLKFPLTVRHWQQGDYFYPIGMKGKKKLSKYFKDQKLSLLHKENIFILCSGDDIVWVINHRMDERFKVTNNTKQILKITYTK